MSLSDVEHRIARTAAARRVSLLEDLRLHVGIPTGLNHTPGLDETRERLCARLVALGARRQDEPGDPRPAWLYESAPSAGGGVPVTAICRRPRGPGPRVLLAGHLDTVHDPRGAFRALSVAPDGKTATGPGCVDMKGGLVIAVAALEVLEECGVPVSWSFVLNSDEETGSYHSDRALRQAAEGHDFGLALEPAMSDGGLAVERGGSGQFMIEARGKAAHVGRDFASGVSAVDALARAIVDAHTRSDAKAGVCVNVGPLQGGLATNVVPDLARAWGNVRFPDPDRAQALERDLLALARGAGERLPLVSVSTSFNRPAKPLTPPVERMALAARRAAEDLGQRLPFGKTAGVCDGNQLQAAGLPTIDTLGVRGAGLHTPQEWIELDSLVERCQLLAVLIARLCAGG
jgi:glutamate carboxypeptidase